MRCFTASSHKTEPLQGGGIRTDQTDGEIGGQQNDLGLTDHWNTDPHLRTTTPNRVYVGQSAAAHHVRTNGCGFCLATLTLAYKLA